MWHFTYRLLKSAFSNCKAELLFVFMGMVICLFLLIQMGGKIFSFQNEYGGMVKDQKAMEYIYNRCIFTYPDERDLQEIVERISGMEGISGVYMETVLSTGESVRCGTRLPLIDENGLVTGKVPDSLSDGQIITSYSVLVNSGVFDGSEYVGAGEEFTIGEMGFENVAEISDPDGYIVTVNDFLLLYEKLGDGEIQLFYVYADGFMEEQQKLAEETVSSIRVPESTGTSLVSRSIDPSLFLNTTETTMAGVILASVNALFLYAGLLKKRISIYAILKLLGITNIRLRGMLYGEFLLLYGAACLVSFVLYGGYLFVTESSWLYMGEVFLYSYGSILAVYTVMFWFLTRKLVKSQPFALYRGQEEGR